MKFNGKFQILILVFLFGCGGEFTTGPKFIDGGLRKFAYFLEVNYDALGADFFPSDYVFKENELPILITNPKFNGELRMPSENELLPIVDSLRKVMLDISKYKTIGVGIRNVTGDSTFYNYYSFPAVVDSNFEY